MAAADNQFVVGGIVLVLGGVAQHDMGFAVGGFLEFVDFIDRYECAAMDPDEAVAELVLE